MNRDFLAGLASLALSLAVNAGAFYVIDHAAVFSSPRASQTRAAKARSDDTLRFEFVEAPPKAHPRKPRNTAKIAARDALNQDAARARVADAAAPPAIGQQDAVDQLAQQRAAAAAAPPPTKVEPPKREEILVPTPLPKEPLAEKTAPSPEDFPMRREEKLSSPQPAPPSTASRGLSGKDLITTQAMSRTKSSGAALFGLTSFEATGSGMGEYMKNLKERIWLAWFPYIAFKYPSDFKAADAVLSITLDREGRVAIVRIVEFGGSAVFASFCVKAVQAASPFGPLPPEILALVGKDELEIKFGFHYR